MTQASNWKVLVVEDTEDDKVVISKIFTHYGAEVIVANNGKDCLSILAHMTPTFIVTDLSMPQMDGWQTLASIRANPDTAHIPVVAVTAYHSADMDVDVQKAGFDAYFPKPVRPAQLMDVIMDLLG